MAEKHKSIRSKLKNVAATELESLLEKVETEVSKMCQGTNIEAVDVCKLIGSNKSATLKKKIINQITNQMEDELLLRFDREQGL